MKKLRLVNLTGLAEQGIGDNFQPFTVEGYEFHSQVRPPAQQGIHVYTARNAGRDNRIHRQNAYVLFGPQDDSVLYRGGMVGSAMQPTHKRKFLEDILLLGSLLTAHNWAFYSRKYTAGYPLVPTNHLRTIATDFNDIQRDLPPLIAQLKDEAWQQRFDNGFHLKMLLNSANNFSSESRFLSRVIIWEFLYAKLFGNESQNLQEIMKAILEHFWGAQVNGTIFLPNNVNRVSQNIFYVLRNQLAHSGKLPIDRPYAEQWMTQIPWEAPFASPVRDLKRYLLFFDELTQVIVMKTMDFHPETRNLFNAFNFNENLARFLSTGRIQP